MTKQELLDRLKLGEVNLTNDFASVRNLRLENKMNYRTNEVALIQVHYAHGASCGCFTCKTIEDVHEKLKFILDIEIYEEQHEELEQNPQEPIVTYEILQLIIKHPLAPLCDFQYDGDILTLDCMQPNRIGDDLCDTFTELEEMQGSEMRIDVVRRIFIDVVLESGLLEELTNK